MPYVVPPHQSLLCLHPEHLVVALKNEKPIFVLGGSPSTDELAFTHFNVGMGMQWCIVEYSSTKPATPLFK
jgi:hypothetical protein